MGLKNGNENESFSWLMNNHGCPKSRYEPTWLEHLANTVSHGIGVTTEVTTGLTRRVVPSLVKNEAVFLLGQLLIDTTFARSNGLRNARSNCLSALLRLVGVFENAFSGVNPISKNTHHEMGAEQLVNSGSVSTLIRICFGGRIAAYWGLSSQHYSGSVVNFLLPLCRCSAKFRIAAIGNVIPAENGSIEHCMKAIESTDDKHLIDNAFKLFVVVTKDAAGRARLRDSGALGYLIDVFAGCFTNEQLYGDVLLQRRDFFASLTICLTRYVAARGDSCLCATRLSLERITKEESVDCADGATASESPQTCDERTPSDASSTATTSTDASFLSGRIRSSVVNVTWTDEETCTPQLAITLCLRIISNNLSRHKPFPTVMACQPQLLNALVNSVSKVAVFPAVWGLYLLVSASDGGKEWTVAWVYGIVTIGLFFMSTVYHLGELMLRPGCSHLRMTLHVCDRVMIYLFIAASYTPWLVLREQGYLGEQLRLWIWIFACSGILYQCLFHEMYKTVETLIYVFLGTVPAVVATSMVVSGAVVVQPDKSGLSYVAIGGGVYLLGVVFFKADGVIPFAHSIWHLHVVLGAFLHFAAIYSNLMSMHPKTMLNGSEPLVSSFSSQPAPTSEMHLDL